MQILHLPDYYCEKCRMPSEPGVCELCRNRVSFDDPCDLKLPHTVILAAVLVIGVIVIAVGFGAVLR